MFIVHNGALHDVNRYHLDILPWLVILIHLCFLDSMDDIETGGCPTKDTAIRRQNEVHANTAQTHVCLLSSQGHGTVVIKNCEPLVFGPALAMLRVYGLQNVGLAQSLP